MEKRWAFSILYYLIVILLLFGFQHWFVSKQISEISYKECKDSIQLGAADEVAMG